MSDWRTAIDREINGLADDIRDMRRYLHAHPEPSRDEFQTTRFVRDRLEQAGIALRVIPSGRGIIAGVEPVPGAPHVALRADMDALRIQDVKDVPYRSTRPGVMHACGHDAHSAMAYGAALALWRSRAAMPWPVSWRALFQPAEEVAEGAAEMVAAGAVDGVDAIVALHVAPDLPVGRVAYRHGFITACCQDIDVVVRGAGGHAARPHLTIDPIAASAQFLTSVYQTVPRSIDAREPVVVSFGAIAGGANGNVIPDRVTIRGTLRTLGRPTAAIVRDRIREIARGVALATRAEIELTFSLETDAVFNDTAVTDVCRDAAGTVVGADHVEAIPLPSMGGEDFSGYLDRVPGCMMRLGVATPGKSFPSLHSSDFDIDEAALTLGARILAYSVVMLSCPADQGARAKRSVPETVTPNAPA